MAAATATVSLGPSSSGSKRSAITSSTRSAASDISFVSVVEGADGMLQHVQLQQPMAARPPLPPLSAQLQQPFQPSSPEPFVGSRGTATTMSASPYSYSASPSSADTAAAAGAMRGRPAQRQQSTAGASAGGRPLSAGAADGDDGGGGSVDGTTAGSAVWSAGTPAAVFRGATAGAARSVSAPPAPAVIAVPDGDDYGTDASYAAEVGDDHPLSLTSSPSPSMSPSPQSPSRHHQHAPYRGTASSSTGIAEEAAAEEEEEEDDESSQLVISMNRLTGIVRVLPVREWRLKREKVMKKRAAVHQVFLRHLTSIRNGSRHPSPSQLLPSSPLGDGTSSGSAASASPTAAKGISTSGRSLDERDVTEAAVAAAAALSRSRPPRRRVSILREGSQWEEDLPSLGLTKAAVAAAAAAFAAAKSHTSQLPTRRSNAAATTPVSLPASGAPSVAAASGDIGGGGGGSMPLPEGVGAADAAPTSTAAAAAAAVTGGDGDNHASAAAGAIAPTAPSSPASSSSAASPLDSSSSSSSSSDIAAAPSSPFGPTSKFDFTRLVALVRRHPHGADAAASAGEHAPSPAPVHRPPGFFATLSSRLQEVFHSGHFNEAAREDHEVEADLLSGGSSIGSSEAMAAAAAGVTAAHDAHAQAHHSGHWFRLGSSASSSSSSSAPASPLAGSGDGDRAASPCGNTSVDDSLHGGGGGGGDRGRDGKALDSPDIAHTTTTTTTAPPSLLPRLPSRPSLRVTLANLVMWSWFERVSLLVILWSSVNLALDSPGVQTCGPSDPPYCARLRAYLDACDVLFTIFFTLELCLNVGARGLIVGRLAYLHSGWRWLDALVVAASIAGLALSSSAGLRSLRAIRSLRALRLAGRFPSLRLVVTALVSALPRVLDVIVLLLLIAYVFAVVGMQMFSGKLGQCNDPSVSVAADCVGTFMLTPPIPPTSNAGLLASQSGGTGDTCVYAPTDALVEACYAAGGLLFPRVWATTQWCDYDSLGGAMLTVFYLTSGENWPLLMQAGVAGTAPAASLYFMLSQLVLNFFLVQL